MSVNSSVSWERVASFRKARAVNGLIGCELPDSKLKMLQIQGTGVNTVNEVQNPAHWEHHNLIRAG